MRSDRVRRHDMTARHRSRGDFARAMDMEAMRTGTGHDGRRRRSARTGRFIRDHEGAYVHHDYAHKVRGYDGNYGYDYDDYDYGEDYLDDDELMEWSKDMLNAVPEQQRQMFTYENIKRKSQEMGMEFDDFTEAEFYTAVLMVYTDYRKTLGDGNIDLYMKLAKDWLCDDDTAVQYSEKLAKYYNDIVEGD